jgi:hypothetical protein
MQTRINCIERDFCIFAFVVKLSCLTELKKLCLPVPKKWLLLDYTHQLHQIKFKQKQGSDVIDWLKFVCYEIALNQGVDDFLMKEAVSEVLK